MGGFERDLEGHVLFTYIIFRLFQPPSIQIFWTILRPFTVSSVCSENVNINVDSRGQAHIGSFLREGVETKFNDAFVFAEDELGKYTAQVPTIMYLLA